MKNEDNGCKNIYKFPKNNDLKKNKKYIYK